SSSSPGEAAASLPDTEMPLASMMRAMPDMPAPPMPTKCTRPRSPSGTGSTGVTSPIYPLPWLLVATPARARRPAPRSQVHHHAGQLAVGVPVAAVAGRLGHRRHQLRVEQDRQQRLLDPLRGQGGVGND